MKAESIKSLISREFLKQALVPILIIELLLLAMYFGINYYISIQTKSTMLDSARSTLVELSSKEANGINLKLNAISKGAKILQSDGEYIFANLTTLPLPKKLPEFAKHSNGVYYKTNDNNGSSLFYSTLTKIDEKAKNKALYTESFDTVFKSFYNSNSDLAVGVYLNTYDSLNRYYPYLPDVYKVFDANMSIPDFNFYYEADLKHNPKKTPVWTDVYLDPAGQGWMATCAVPVYKNDFLEGVIGIDITVEKFIKSILSLKLPWGSQAFLVNKNGTILAMGSEVETIFGLTELKKHVYNDTIKKDTLKPEEFNLLKNKNTDLTSAIKPLLTGAEKIKTININNAEYTITASSIDETGWKLFVLADNSIVLADASSLKSLSNNIGILAVLLMVAFYIVFFIILSKHSITVTKDITKPIDDLVEAAEQMAKRTYIIRDFDSHGIEEIDRLIVSFNKMSIELDTLYDTLEERIADEVNKNKEKDAILLKQAKAVAMSELLRNISHHWRQPLNTVGLSIQELELLSMDNQLTHDDVKDASSSIMRDVNFMSKTIDTFRNLLEESGEAVEFDVANQIQKVIAVLEDQINSEGVTVNINTNCHDSAKGSLQDFSQVVMSIITNCQEAFYDKNIDNKHIDISVSCANDNIIIDIADNAGGIHEQIIDRLFEPYLTTKFKSQGVGLGLYSCKKNINDMKGSITAKNVNGGAQITITLPKSDSGSGIAT